MSHRTFLSGVVALAGCVGEYGEGPSAPPERADAEVAPPDDGAPEPPPRDDGVSEGDAAASPPDAGASGDAEPAPDADVLLAHSAAFDGYLTDRGGRPLYMLADDVAGAKTTACLSACAQEWPPFDLAGLTPGEGLLANEFTRFHRQDGAWQTAFKGHPLYLRASEAGDLDVTGDGAEGRWFVARDYLAFLARTSGLAPAGSDSFDALYLTNGFGRALYVCFDDTEGGPGAIPVTSCVGECALKRPLWSVIEAGRTSVLPSVLDPSDLGQFQRPDGAVQLTYRGWPLYYFANDQRPGDVQGHNHEAWRALDPVKFTGQRAQ